MIYTILFLGIFNLLLGLIVLIHTKHEKVNVSFLGFAIVASLWTFSTFIFHQNASIEMLRIAYGLGILVGAFGLVWTSYFLEKKLKKYIVYFVVPFSFLFFFVTIFTDWVIVDQTIDIETTLYKAELGPLFGVYAAFMAVVLISIVFILVKKYIQSKNQRMKRQVQTILIGTFLFAAIALVVSFVLPQFFQIFEYSIFDTAGFSIYLLFIVYALVKQELFDVKVITTEIFTFSLWIILLIRTILSGDLVDYLINGTVLALAVLVGVFLIRSVLNEVRQREKIEELVKDLEQANRELKELDKLKTEFLSLATHQIRSPLGAIRGYASMIMEGDYGKIPKKVQEPVQVIHDSAKSLVDVVEDFLNVSRIEQGRMEYDMEELDIKEFVEETVREYEPNAKEKGLEMKFKADKDLHAVVQADQNKLKQSVANIIDNSIKYTPEGSITVSLEKDEEKVYIKVSDTGVGIPKDEIPKLFAKFQRAKGANKVNTTGAGLGMYLAKKIVEAHGGDITIESEGEGQGSTFSIELPVAKS